ncbi:MAG: SOS response-associated peptidase [Gemmatimonadetes bacterium]|nr:SOS response-associated peptidase [Gemmatimonadota bacterium]
MCGRYTLTADSDALLEEFGPARLLVVHKPRYNIAPTQEAPVLAAKDGQRYIVGFRWGLIPYWARDPAIGNRMINARAETAARRPAFRRAFERRRCVVLADGFYEWTKESGGKWPMLVRLKAGGLFGIAGLWDRWRPPGGGQPFRTFTILTTDANDLLRPIHDRMPAVLPPEACDRWLDPRADPASLLELLRPHASQELDVYRVSRLVNSPENDRPECVEPV